MVGREHNLPCYMQQRVSPRMFSLCSWGPRDWCHRGKWWLWENGGLWELRTLWSLQKSVKEGLLLKQTSSFQRWKRRYFKLRGRTLYYAKDAKVGWGDTVSMLS